MVFLRFHVTWATATLGEPSQASVWNRQPGAFPRPQTDAGCTRAIPTYMPKLRYLGYAASPSEAARRFRWSLDPPSKERLGRWRSHATSHSSLARSCTCRPLARQASCPRRRCALAGLWVVGRWPCSTLACPGTHFVAGARESPQSSRDLSLALSCQRLHMVSIFSDSMPARQCWRVVLVAADAVINRSRHATLWGCCDLGQGRFTLVVGWELVANILLA